ncbi:MAG: hypothetical protein JNN18_15035 [Rubrivivax sp.]|nr:hypothetical protein [Rubrivivax sp.]
MTPRFILRATGAPRADAERLAEALSGQRGVRVLDRTPRMLLVTGPRPAVEGAMHAFAGWVLAPETMTPLPDPKPRLKSIR